MGYRVAIVEKWNPHAHIRQDMFGIFDLVAIHRTRKETIGIQTTSASNVSHRVEKMSDTDHIGAVMDALGARWRVQVHGWRKKGYRYIVRVVEASDAGEDFWQDVSFASGGSEGSEEEGRR